MEEIERKPLELNDDELLHAIECILFVAGDPVYIEELTRLFSADRAHIYGLLKDAEERMCDEGRGVLFSVTESTVQLVSNKAYDDIVVEFLQPAQIKSFSQSMLETLTIVAYRQPVTRSEIDGIRGIRSEYSVTQLIKQGFITECGRKDVVGRPMLFCTTDKFLRKFGLRSLEELPDFEKFSELALSDDANDGSAKADDGGDME